MRIAEFERHLASYGTDLGRWPAKLRDDAATLIANSDKARALLRSEERLNALFIDTIPAAPGAASIVQPVSARPQIRPVPLLAQLLRPGQPIFGRARVAVLASCLGAGLLVGFFSSLGDHGSNLLSLNLIDGSDFEVNDE